MKKLEENEDRKSQKSSHQINIKSQNETEDIKKKQILELKYIINRKTHYRGPIAE